MVAANGSVNGVTKRVGFLDPTFVPLRGRRYSTTKPLGTGGTPVSGGYVVTADRDRRLQGTERWRTYSDLVANIDIVATGLRDYVDLVGAAEWKFEPIDGSGAEAVRLADLVEEILHGMTTPWFRVVRRAAMFRFHGYAVSEWTAVLRDDGVIGFLDVEPRAQSTIEKWDVDETGTVHGLFQRSPHDGKEIYLPRAKLLYLVDDSVDDNPEGFGLLRSCAPHGVLLREYERLERVGYQSDISGIPIARAPLAENDDLVRSAKMDPAVRTARENALHSLLTAHIRSETLGAMLDSATYESVGDGKRSPGAVYKWGLDVVKSTPSAQDALAAAIERKTRAIARILGVEHRLLGSDSKGSYALGEGKAKSFGLLIDSALKAITAQVRQDLILPLFRLNGWPEELAPWPLTDLSRFRDAMEVTGALRDMATAGAPMAPDDPAQNAVRVMLGLPEVDLEKIAEDAALAREEAMAIARGDGKVPDAEDDEDDSEDGAPVGAAEDDEDED